MTKLTHRSILCLALALLPAAPAFTVDGVLEINQTCAEEGACFAGDSDKGFPVTITEPGSYRLTSNLIVPDENTDGIIISTSDVGLDLNEFAIIRSGCERVIEDCTPAQGTGAGVGILPGYLARGISVKNGSITGMGQYGVLLGFQAMVTNLRVRWNRSIGIYASGGSTVSGCAAHSNGGTGIYVLDGSTVWGNTAFENNGIGILADRGSTVSGNAAYKNTGTGIATDGGSIVSGNTVFENGEHGITTLSGSTILGNTTTTNAFDGIHTTVNSTVSDNTATGNTGDGIQTGFGSSLHRNIASNNAGYGLNLDPLASYRENMIQSNTLGTVNAGINAGANVCDTNTTCP